jgi:hypothetical protein
MDKKTKKALLDSIEHWHQNLDMLILNHLSDYPLAYDLEIYNNTCPLCKYFYIVPYKREVRLLKVGGRYKAVESMVKDYRRVCWGCPIQGKTLKNRCKGTSWAYIEMLLSHSVRNIAQHKIEGYKKVYDAVVSELEFLYSLLES